MNRRFPEDAEANRVGSGDTALQHPQFVVGRGVVCIFKRYWRLDEVLSLTDFAEFVVLQRT